MNFLPISDNTARQAIDAANIWAEYLRTRAAAKPYAGGMYWKKEGTYEYLVKTLNGNKQQRLGPRSPDTEHTFETFHARKKATEARLSSLTAALDEAQRQNKAVRAGRTPEIVVKLLNALREAGLEKHFRVVGTHALYAYEAAAGVRIAPGALATQDVDLLWDASRRVQFLVDLQRDAGSILAVLQRVDPSFQRRDDALKNESAINDKGFEVEFLRRENEAGDLHPFQFSDNEGDLGPVQARRAVLLAQSPMFSQPVISATGKMATINTVDPRTFVEFKRWMAALADREPAKRRRDALQADTVHELLETKMLVSAISHPR
jgi:hypothetical protein